MTMWLALLINRLEEGLERGWVWVKAHWKWVVAAVGALAGFVLLGRNKLTVVAPALVGADDKKRQIEAEVTKEIDAVEADRLQQLDAVHAAHAEVVATLNLQQQAKVAELSSDPQALNSFLLSVGKKQRE